jgi:hypothetical protein
MEENAMNKKEHTQKQAGTIHQGLTGTNLKIGTLCGLGKDLGITADEITCTVQKKKWIYTCVMIAVASILAASSYVVFSKPAFYISISSKDFDAVGQMMYHVVGRLR